MSLSLSTEVRVSVCGLTPCHSWLALAGGQLTAAQLLLPAAGLGYIRTSAWAGLGWAGLGWDTPNTFLPLATIWPPPASSVTSVGWVAWLTGDMVYPVCGGCAPATRHPPPGQCVRAGD